MSFWSWITSDAPADEIVDEKWDGRLDKAAEWVADRIDDIEQPITTIGDGLRCYEETEGRS